MSYLKKYFDFFGKKVKKLIKKPIDEICTVRTYHSPEEELPISVTRPGNYLYWNRATKKITYENFVDLFSHDRKISSGSDGFFFALGDGFKRHLKFHDKWAIKTVKLPILFNDIIEIIEKIDSNLQIYSGHIGYNGRNLYDKSRKGSYYNLAEFFFNFSIMDDYADKIPSDIFNEYKSEISKKLKNKRDGYLSIYEIDENSNFYKILNIENDTTMDNTTHGKISLSVGIDFSVIYCDMPKGHDRYCSAFHTKD